MRDLHTLLRNTALQERKDPIMSSINKLLGMNTSRVSLRNYCGEPLSGATSSGSTQQVIGDQLRDSDGVLHRQKISYISGKSSIFLDAHWNKSKKGST